MPTPPSRRDFLWVAAGGSATLLAGCGKAKRSNKPSAATINRLEDIKMLNGALALENTAIAAYTAATALLKGPAHVLGRTLLAHEREHARVLQHTIRQAGGRPAGPNSAAEYKQSFPELRSQRDVLRFAADLENAAIATYLDAIPRLSDPQLRQTAAAIMSSEAQHEALLQGALTGNDVKREVPDAFVTGKV